MIAPIFRAVEQHPGEVAERPSKFGGALSEADAYCRELDGLRELQCRVDELTAERDELAEELADVRDLNHRLVNENARLRNERDTIRAAAAVTR